jgi:hypothetical protein
MSKECQFYMGNLPHGIDEDAIRKAVEPFGTIYMLDLRGCYAFIDMGSVAERDAAMNGLRGSTFENLSTNNIREVKIRLPRSKAMKYPQHRHRPLRARHSLKRRAEGEGNKPF